MISQTCLILPGWTPSPSRLASDAPDGEALAETIGTAAAAAATAMASVSRAPRLQRGVRDVASDFR